MQKHLISLDTEIRNWEFLVDPDGLHRIHRQVENSAEKQSY